MSRRSVIVSIGEALVQEFADRVEPGGLALRAAIAASGLGHQGVPISRIGQDHAGDELLRQIRERGIDAAHLQYDPDLPTGRLTVRAVGARVTRSLSPRAAFDNLQWDFDLVDVAQQADAVISGELARREGQSRSIIKRFLAECRNAVRLYDMTNRGDQRIDRGDARAALELSDVLVADETALKALVPAWQNGEVRAAAADILRGGSLGLIVAVEHTVAGEQITIHDEARSCRAESAYPAEQHDAAMIGVLHGVLAGWDANRTSQAAARLASFAAAHPEQPLSAALK